MAHDDRVETLDSGTCWQLLRSASVGRLAVATEHGADIFPVNFVVDHGTVVFRTAAGTKLVAALSAEAVAFETDGLHADVAWSVVLRGHAAEITGVQDTLDTFALPLFPWHETAKNRFVRIDPLEVSGRRFRVADPATWANGLSGAHRTAEE